MTDIFTQGYVGISTRPDYRFYQHKQNAKAGKIYNKAFLKALKNDSAIQDIILIGSVRYCKEIEQKLRPNNYIGWNVAVGGDGGMIKHGLSGTKVKGTYYNILSKASISGAVICPEWSCKDTGLEAFAEFYDRNVKKGQVVHIAGLSYISPSTVRILTQQEMVADSKRSHDLNNDGVLYTVEELGVMFQIKPNTIVWRLKRGETLRQALRLEEKPKITVSVDGRVFEYRGRLSEKELTSFKIDVESGIPILHLANKYNMDHGNLSRLAKKMKIEIPKVFCDDFLGGKFLIASHSKLCLEDFIYAKKRLLEGIPRYLIAEELGVTASCMTDICSKLKWREFLEQKDTMG